MTEKKPTRRELLRPLHLLGIATVAGLFAGIVTLVTTGAFTERVYESIAAGELQGQHPALLAVIIGGIAFIATLLLLSILILAVDPAQVTKPVDRPVLYDEVESDAESADAAASDEGSSTA